MSIPLDDLLPVSDAGYIPPDSAEFFDSGKPFWEFSDFHKWARFDDAKTGYWMACFDVALKSGRSFAFDRGILADEAMLKRAHDFERSVTFYSEQFLIVSGADQKQGANH